MAELTKFEKFEMVKVHRSEIHGVKWNPRIMEEDAKKKLRKFIKTFGLLGPITVNKRTYNIVGGHQRLFQTDELEGNQDYWLNVAMVELNDKEEREANVALNNPNMQGSYDGDLLNALLNDPIIIGDEPLKFDYDEAGLSIADLNILGVDIAPTVSEFQEPESGGVEQLSAIARKEDIKRKKAVYAEKALADNSREYSLIVVFQDRKRLDTWLERQGLPVETKFLASSALDAIIFHAKPQAGEVTVAISAIKEVAALWDETVVSASKVLGYNEDYPNRAGRIFELMLGDFNAGNIAEPELMEAE